MRLSIVVLIVAAVIGTAFIGVRKAVADAQPRAKSWSVPYVDVTLTPTYQFQDPQSNPSRDVALAFVVADPEDACRPELGWRLHPRRRPATTSTSTGASSSSAPPVATP